MRTLFGRRLARLALASAGLLALAGGITYAAIPDGSHIIHGCYTTGGTLRVIDTDAGQACRNSETSLDWNQTGPQGVAGQNGTADAFARIAADGTVITSLAKNVAQANVTHPQTGVYCIGGLVVNGQPYSPKIAIGNGTAGLAPDGNGGLIPSPGSDAIIEATALGDEANVTLGLCPDTAKVRIYTYSAGNHALADRSFQILFDD